MTKQGLIDYLRVARRKAIEKGNQELAKQLQADINSLDQLQESWPNREVKNA